MTTHHIISQGRPNPILTYFYTSENTMSQIITTLLLLYFLPAFLSCTKYETYTETSGVPRLRDTIPTTLYIKSIPGGGTLDIFTFDDDRLRRLDSYQRIYGYSGGPVSISSRSGSKIVVAVANIPAGRDRIDRILSYDDLASLHTELKDEDIGNPVMCGETAFEAGKSGFGIDLKPLLAEIRLNSISCDFHGRPYEGMKLEDVKVYLTNVCSRYPIAGEAPELPESILNQGGYSEQDMEGLADSSILSGEISGGIGTSVLYPEISLYCYPNEAATEGPGTPFTRMVIEGTLDGKKTYYPINVNRVETSLSSGHTGIARNMSYVYDITITRRGVDDPDTPVYTDIIGIPMYIEEWNVKSGRTITY